MDKKLAFWFRPLKVEKVFVFGCFESFFFLRENIIFEASFRDSSKIRCEKKWKSFCFYIENLFVVNFLRFCFVSLITSCTRKNTNLKKKSGFFFCFSKSSVNFLRYLHSNHLNLFFFCNSCFLNNWNIAVYAKTILKTSLRFYWDIDQDQLMLLLFIQ